jgi:hypothetical protein
MWVSHKENILDKGRWFTNGVKEDTRCRGRISFEAVLSSKAAF